jgi:hypothetical protein
MKKSAKTETSVEKSDKERSSKNSYDTHINYHGSVSPPFTVEEEFLRDNPWRGSGFSN